MNDLDDGAPDVQAWELERIRLTLVFACALKQLAMHVGTADMDVSFEGRVLQIRMVTVRDPLSGLPIDQLGNAKLDSGGSGERRPTLPSAETSPTAAPTLP